jgi:vacuolar-type H+-ATPase subunit H
VSTKQSPVIQAVRSSDGVLQELVTERRKQVEALQKRQAEQLKEAETRGQQEVNSLTETLGKDYADVFRKLETRHAEAAKRIASKAQGIREEMANSAIIEAPLTAHPELAFGRLIAPAILIGIRPYYGTLHGADGSIYWQGYNPGNLDLWDSASGSGPGWFGTGAGSFTVYLDWWFVFKPDASRYYNYVVNVPFHGYYLIHADDGFWDSKEAHVRIDISAQGYQYNWKAKNSTDVLDLDSQNINDNDRFDGWRTTYYSDLLGGGDSAYLLVSTSFYVYARGGGSYAELNFSAGAANYMGVPYLNVS